MRDHFFEQLQHYSQAAQRILLTGPISPDADSIASCLALKKILHSTCKAEIIVAGKAPYRYRNLPGISQLVEPHVLSGSFSLAIVLDGDRHRLDEATKRYFEQARYKGIIDHHVSTQNASYDLCWLDKDASSTTSLIYGLMQYWNIELDPVLAYLIYSGLVFDTGGFCYENTTPITLQLASKCLAQGIPHTNIYHEILHERSPVSVHLLGAVLQHIEYSWPQKLAFAYLTEDFLHDFDVQADDFDGLVELLLHTRGIEVSVLCIQQDKLHHKLSLRSCASSKVDVSLLAQSLSVHGGGHMRAAGARVVMPRTLIKQTVVQVLCETYG